MATSRDEIRSWIVQGQAQGARYMIVVCDTYDWEDYPIYVGPDDDFGRRYAGHNGVNMERIMEIYDLQSDVEAQLQEHRAFHPPADFQRGQQRR